MQPHLTLVLRLAVTFGAMLQKYGLNLPLEINFLVGVGRRRGSKYQSREQKKHLLIHRRTNLGTRNFTRLNMLAANPPAQQDVWSATSDYNSIVPRVAANVGGMS
jgi:hypothetical protein